MGHVRGRRRKEGDWVMLTRMNWLIIGTNTGGRSHAVLQIAHTIKVVIRIRMAASVVSAKVRNGTNLTPIAFLR